MAKGWKSSFDVIPKNEKKFEKEKVGMVEVIEYKGGGRGKYDREYCRRDNYESRKGSYKGGFERRKYSGGYGGYSKGRGKGENKYNGGKRYDGEREIRRVYNGNNKTYITTVLYQWMLN